MNEQQDLEQGKYTQALKAVTKKFECDYCHRTFASERETVLHVYQKHISSQ
jgi:hypothetical protein